MTIDLMTDQHSTRQRTFARATVQAAMDGVSSWPVKSVIVVFGGWGVAKAGEVLDLNGETTGTTLLIKALKALKPADGTSFVIRAFNGALTEENTAEQNILRTISADFHPLGKLIVIGYSAGGFSAMRTAYQLGMSHPCYDTTTRSFSPFLVPIDQKNGKIKTVYGFARIDLLVTIDAADGPLSGVTNRRVWPSVRRNLNIYQTAGSSRKGSSGSHYGVYSHGGPNTAFDSSVTEVKNIDWTSKYSADPGEGHVTIDDDSIADVTQAVREELDR